MQTAQAVQAELQQHLQESLRTGLNITNGLVDHVRASTAYLQTTLDDTSAKVAHMTNFGGFTRTIFRWSWAILIILAVSLYSGRVAGYIARCFGNSRIEQVVDMLLICTSGVGLLVEALGFPDGILRTSAAIVPISMAPIARYPFLTRLGGIGSLSVILFLLGCAIYWWTKRCRRQLEGDKQSCRTHKHLV